jgi:hypothetical protein
MTRVVANPAQAKPTIDDAAGMRWWNSLTRGERAMWLERARSAVPADAWAAYKGSPA